MDNIECKSDLGKLMSILNEKDFNYEVINNEDKVDHQILTFEVMNVEIDFHFHNEIFNDIDFSEYS